MDQHRPASDWYLTKHVWSDMYGWGTPDCAGMCCCRWQTAKNAVYPIDMQIKTNFLEHSRKIFILFDRFWHLLFINRMRHMYPLSIPMSTFADSRNHIINNIISNIKYWTGRITRFYPMNHTSRSVSRVKVQDTLAEKN